MVSTNDNKNLGAVKGTMAKFLGVKLKKEKKHDIGNMEWVQGIHSGSQ
jgi:hypothetical protein